MLLIPIGHENQKFQRLPWFTIALIAINSLLFLYQYTSGYTEAEMQASLKQAIAYFVTHPYLKVPVEFKEMLREAEVKELEEAQARQETPMLSPEEIHEQQQELNRRFEGFLQMVRESPDYKYGHRPAEPVWWSYFSSMFLHASLIHLLGNMLFLYLAGCALEDAWGRPLYLAFYLAGGIWATLFHDLRFQQSTVPLVGASGAIAALMGAFLIRFYKTKIRFWYLIGIWIRGQFLAPAWIVLPLWLILQILLDKAVGTESGVALAAHIGGFISGAAFALVINVTRFEERFIAPMIQKKVELAINPKFVRAVNLEQKMDYVQSRSLLQQVLREEPDNLDAHMEMRRIAELTQNSEAYASATTTLLDALIRRKETDMVLQVYRELELHSAQHRIAVSPRTLLSVGAYLEQLPDYRSALEVYEAMADAYPEDPQTVKALSRAASIYLERMDQREKGARLFWKAFQHPKCDESWKTVLRGEFKRFQIPLPQEPQAIAQTTPAAIEHNALPGASDPKEYAQPESVWIDSLSADGMTLVSQTRQMTVLPWKQIRRVSVGRIRSAGPAPPGRSDYLIVDFIPKQPGTFYRTYSYRMDFKKLQPDTPGGPEAYRTLMTRILRQSGASCTPSQDACLGPAFQVFQSPEAYEGHVRNLETVNPRGEL